MNIIRSIYNKEIKYYFYSLTNYVFVIIFAALSIYLYFQNFFIQGQADVAPWSQNLPFLLIFFIPALSMGTISEEKRLGTWEILLTLPTQEIQVVLAKFLAGFTFVLFLLFSTIGIPVTLAFLGKPDWGVVASSYLGGVALAGAYLSTGIFVSSLVRQQTISFVITFLFLLVNDIFSQDFFLLRAPVFLKGIFQFLSLRSHYENFAQGQINLDSVVFLFSWIIFFILLTIISLRSRDF